MPPSRLAILQAEERRAASPADLLTLRTGIRSRDPQAAILAIRAIGRLERPSLVTDLIPALRFSLPEVRAEAANAIGQAAQGWNESVTRPFGKPDLGAMLTTLIAELDDEERPSVRAALCETIGRLPYQSPDDAAKAEAALVDMARSSRQRPRSPRRRERARGARPPPAWPAADRAIAPSPRCACSPASTTTTTRAAGPSVCAMRASAASRSKRSSARSAIDELLVVHAATDPDPQVRRLAMRAAAASGKGTGILARGLQDPAAMVRLDALRGFAVPARRRRVRDVRRGDERCRATRRADRVRSARRLRRPRTGARTAHSNRQRPFGRRGAARLASRRARDRRPGRRRAGSRRRGPRTVSPRRRGGSCASTPLGQRPRCASATAPHARRRRPRQRRRSGDRGALENRGARCRRRLSSGVCRARDIKRFGRRRSRSTRRRATGEAVPGAESGVDPPDRGKSPELVGYACRDCGDARDASARRFRPRRRRRGRARAPCRPRICAGWPRRARASRSRTSAHSKWRCSRPRRRSRSLRFAALAESGYYNGLTFHRVVPNFVVQGGSPGANEYVGARRLHARRSRPVAPREGRGGHLHARPRHRRRAVLRRPRRQPAVRPRVHGLWPAPERHRGRRPDSRRGCDRAGRDHAVDLVASGRRRSRRQPADDHARRAPRRRPVDHRPDALESDERRPRLPARDRSMAWRTPAAWSTGPKPSGCARRAKRSPPTTAAAASASRPAGSC